MMEAVYTSEMLVYSDTIHSTISQKAVNLLAVWMFSIVLKMAYIISYLFRILFTPDNISCLEVAISAVCVVGMNII
jgi:hypothetical protein